MNAGILIRPETSADRDAIWQVQQQAFGRDDEANLVNALRDGGFVRVSLLVQLAERVVGHILFSDLPISTEASTTPALALAPLAVLPAHQQQGLGTALVQAGLDRCRREGHEIVLVLGDPAYYARFGFSSELAANLESPYPRAAFQALELMPGALGGVKGRVCYPPPFGSC